MFGYVRPLKSELLVREFTRYRAVYCGICKRLGTLYGQLPRLGVNYDAVLLGIMLLSLQEDDPGESAETCVANPMKKRPVARPSLALDACASMTVILAWHKGKDDTADGRVLRGLAARSVFGRAARLASRSWPGMAEAATEGLALLAGVESHPVSGSSAVEASGAFGCLTAGLFGAAADKVLPQQEAHVREALRRLGDSIGRWIYLMDAIDDLAADADNGNWNPFSGMEAEAAAACATAMLEPLEADMDRTCALLPYVRDAGIVSNIIQSGLPGVRTDVLGNNGLGRL